MRNLQNKKLFVPKIRINRVSVVIWTFLFFGIIAGSFYYSLDMKDSLVLQGKNIWEIFSVSLIEKPGLFKFIFLKSISFIILVFLGTSVVGYPFVVMIPFAVAFEKGAVLTFFISKYGLQGFLICLLCLIPQYIIYCWIIFSASKLSFNYSFSLHNYFSQAKRLKTDTFSIKDLIIKYLLLYSIYFICIVWEYFISPVIFKIFL